MDARSRRPFTPCWSGRLSPLCALAGTSSPLCARRPWISLRRSSRSSYFHIDAQNMVYKIFYCRHFTLISSVWLRSWARECATPKNIDCRCVTSAVLAPHGRPHPCRGIHPRRRPPGRLFAPPPRHPPRHLRHPSPLHTPIPLPAPTPTLLLLAPHPLLPPPTLPLLPFFKYLLSSTSPPYGATLPPPSPPRSSGVEGGHIPALALAVDRDAHAAAAVGRAGPGGKVRCGG